ncbi:hypothetical protein EV424DRAFT_390224 [Suillus variegatus]|nr:hypothetical protein EV424DRAFT_390224 [Suillus variegatus]
MWDPGYFRERLARREGGLLIILAMLHHAVVANHDHMHHICEQIPFQHHPLPGFRKDRNGGMICPATTIVRTLMNVVAT